MADSLIQCSGCRKQMRLKSECKPTRVKCSACGAITALAAIEKLADAQPAASPVVRLPANIKPAQRPNAPMSGRRALVLVLLAGYVPFLVAVSLTFIVIFVWLQRYVPRPPAKTDPILGILLASTFLIGATALLTVLHVAWFWIASLTRRNGPKDPLEFELPDEWQKPLLSLIEQVVEKGDLPEPDRICIHASSVAHVYEDDLGRCVLAIGGLAIAALPQRALAGVIAHELGHYAGGDTALSRMAIRWHEAMARLEWTFRSRWRHNLNPTTWIIRGYHQLYQCAWYANKRDQEYAADAHEVRIAGPEQAAAALVLIEVMQCMPWADLEVVAEHYVVNNDRPADLFAELLRRVKASTPSEWQDALRRALKRKTRWYHTHPCLRDRLAAIGVSSKTAFKLAMDLSGTPSTALFANWPVVEKFLSRQIFNIVRENYWSKTQFHDLARAVCR